MKIRLGFVSNSSSSSFICDISGREESGWDISLNDIGMYQCQNGHTIDEKYVDLEGEEYESIIKRDAEKWMEEYGDENSDIENVIDDIKSEFRYELPPKFCPICQMKNFTHRDLRAFLIVRNAEHFGVGKKEGEQLLYKDIRERFSNYKEFKEYIK
uniref:Uncharacterized protein n=1 Tax=viral metagenome TaxID=1070528 RepID=A0A6M3JZJ8_9ZZZZ